MVGGFEWSAAWTVSARGSSYRREVGRLVKRCRCGAGELGCACAGPGEGGGSRPDRRAEGARVGFSFSSFYLNIALPFKFKVKHAS
jgi:hypothetical protein